CEFGAGRRGRSDVSTGASGHHRCGAPCDAAGQWSAMSSGQRRRAPSLPRIAAAGGPWARSVGGGLLPDVEPRAFSRHPATSGGAGGDLPPGAWALRRVLERFPRLLWTRLAREVLFLSHGPRPLVDGAALCGIESGSRRNGGGGGGMAVVQRRGPLWSGGKRVSGTLLGRPGVAEGGLQREFCHGLGYPFLRSLRPAPRESLPDIFDFFLALGLVQPLHIVARRGHRPRAQQLLRRLVSMPSGV